MNHSNNKHIAVVGAGIIGINCALSLRNLGYEVTLIDKEGVGSGCSQRNAGHFATEQVFPLAEAGLLLQLPKLLLDPLGPMALSPSYFPKALPWFLRFMANMPSKIRNKNSEAIKALNKNAIDYYKPLLKDANAEHLLTTDGSLLVFEDTPYDEVKRHWQHYHGAGVSVELLNRQQTLALEPNLSDKINHALYFTDVGHTASPAAICDALAESAFAKGVHYQQLEISNISDNKDGVTITANEQSYQFDQIVIATGAWSKAVLAQLGYKLPLEVERGYSLDIADKQEGTPSLNRPVASAERKFIMTPMQHGLRLSGTVEFAGLKQKPNYKRADLLFQHAHKMLDEISDFDPKSASDEQRWLGFRPSLPDSLPVIGRAPNHDNIFCALGHQHLGLTQGAITGALIGQLIKGDKTDIDLSPYSLARFN